MNSIHHIFFCYLIVSFIHHLNGDFTPDTTDYDAYGLKIAMNDKFLVLAQNSNQPPRFLIQFAPYNDTETSSQCYIEYPNDTTTYIYTVAVGKNQNQSQTHFFFAGEQINGQSGPFVGVVTYNDTSGTANISNNTSFACNTSFSYSLQYFNNYQHQDYYILGVEPNGVLAYGFTNNFIFVFDSRNPSIVDSWDGNLTWPDASFIPHAVQISNKFGVIAGFIRNAVNAVVKYSPMIYLINFNSSNHHPVIVDSYKPVATPNTWQNLLTYADAEFYSAKYEMSVSINDYGDVLVGMQFINRVFLFSVNTTNPRNLTAVSRYTNGRSLGNGKSVAWLDNGIAAVLINVYTLDYKWSLSQIFIFDIHTSGYISTTTPLSVFPNSHQLAPDSFSSVFLNIVSSPSSLAILDNQGKIIILTPTQPGYYPSVQDTGSIPFVTSSVPCMAGTYKTQTGIHDCVLCPTGTKNAGNYSLGCIPCSSGSFCPLGSVNDVPQSVLETTLQAIAYPQSPESIIFDEILIRNMFTIGSGRCIVVSPLFWTIMVAGVAIIIIIFMEILKVCIKHPRGKKVRDKLKCTFRYTDLIGEGELWVGGLASFALVVFVCFSYAFSNGFLKQYPIETSYDSYFTCDLSMRNAKFQTNIQSLAIPSFHSQQEIFDLLDNQNFTLNLDFVNTLINCDAVSLEALFGVAWTTIRWSNCNNSNSILTLSIPLIRQHLSIHVFLADTKTVGGLRVGLFGNGTTQDLNTLQELNFRQAFFKNGYMLSQTLPIDLAMSRVINETLAMVGEESQFGGLYIPTFTGDSNSLFVTNDQYVRTSLTLTTVTIVISETPFYVQNVQQPIAKQSEIVFRDLLFTVVSLEIFGLIFIFYKLIFKPLYHTLIGKRCNAKEKNINDKKQTNGDINYANNFTNINEMDHNFISSAL